MPNCSSRPHSSVFTQLSAILFSAMRKRRIPVNVTSLPVGATPMNSPSWIPRLLQRTTGNEGADTIVAQTAVDLAGAREEIFGGDGDDIITAADGLVDVIDCGLGRDTVFSYDTELDVLVDCEATSPEAATVVGN
jgi:hypothetical protein